MTDLPVKIAVAAARRGAGGTTTELVGDDDVAQEGRGGVRSVESRRRRRTCVALSLTLLLAVRSSLVFFVGWLVDWLERRDSVLLLLIAIVLMQIMTFWFLII